LFERFRTTRQRGLKVRRFVMHVGFVEDLERGGEG
jgi:hypothetical protein